MMLRAAFVLPDTVVEELRALTGRICVLPGIRPEPTEHLDVRVALLGNVGSEDAHALAAAVERELARVVVPVARFGGIEVRPDGDVAVTLCGDVDVLGDVARTVGTVAERIHVYVDRRSFRPAVVVASLGPQRPGSPVVRALEAVAPVQGAAWPVADVALIRTRWLAGAAVSEVFERAPIGTASGTAVVDGE